MFYKFLRAAALACLSMALPALASAQAVPQVASQAAGTIQPFLPPTGFALQSNSTKGADGRPALYGGMRPDANWFFAAMGNPGDWPPFIAGADGASWSTSAPWGLAKFSLEQGVPTETILQNGGTLPCTNLMGIPKEYDMAVTPNGNNLGYPSSINKAFYASNKNFPMLGQLASFNLSGTLTIAVAGQPVPVSTCKVNHASAAFTIILVNNAASPHQFFWYSVSFKHVCLPASPTDPGQDFLSCSAGSRRLEPIWFWSGSGGVGRHVQQDLFGRVKIANFAVSDPVAAYGAAMITDNQPHVLSLDLLSRLSTLITSSKDGIDPDLMHWRVAGVTFGQELWGDTLLSTTWQGFVPTWTVKPGA